MPNTPLPCLRRGRFTLKFFRWPQHFLHSTFCEFLTTFLHPNFPIVLPTFLTSILYNFLHSHNTSIFTNLSALFELEICMNICEMMEVMDGHKVICMLRFFENLSKIQNGHSSCSKRMSKGQFGLSPKPMFWKISTCFDFYR